MFRTGGSMTLQLEILLIWIGITSLISIILTVYDKIAAKKRPQSRIRERTLMLWSAVGGSLAMFVTMQLIRHKTKHKLFMIGIPVIMLLQAAALVLAHLYVIKWF